MNLSAIFFNILIFSPSPSATEVPPVMYQFLSEVLSLQPEFSSPAAFRDEQHRKKVSDGLKKMAELSKNLDSHDRLNDPIFKMTADLVKDQMQEAYQSFQNGHYDYARRLFQGALDGCSSCHNQIPKSKNLAWEFNPDRLQGSPYQKAEFWFTVRQYHKALPLYENFVANFDPKKNASYQLDLALQRIASILIRNDLDLKKAEDTFLKISANRKIPSATRQKMRRWSEEAKKLNQSGIRSSNLKTLQDVETWAKNFLDDYPTTNQTSPDAESIKALFLSGALYQYVHINKNFSPEVLYYLSRCEEILDDDFFLGLGNIYLRRCVLEFPQTKMATKCLRDLKQKTELAFTGSSGIQIPEDVAADLKALEMKVSTAQKKQNKK
jgi:hypothetical protein